MQDANQEEEQGVGKDAEAVTADDSGQGTG